jgi:hypothetical protein
MKHRSGRRSAVALIVSSAAVWAPGLVFAQPAPPAEPRVYAVISLVGDALRVVGDQATTGSAVGRNMVENIPLQFETVELAAVRAVAGSLMKADTTSKVAPVKITDPAIYAAQADFVSGDRVALPAGIVDPLRGSPVTHLVLITRYRSEAKMQTGLLRLGSGRVEGLGFYLDRDYSLRMEGTNEITVGYLAPYVYVRVSLIEMRTQKLLRTETVTDSWVYTPHGKKTGSDPWNILSDREKVTTVSEMLEKQLVATVPKLLAQP